MLKEMKKVMDEYDKEVMIPYKSWKKRNKKSLLKISLVVYGSIIGIFMIYNIIRCIIEIYDINLYKPAAPVNGEEREEAE